MRNDKKAFRKRMDCAYITVEHPNRGFEHFGNGDNLIRIFCTVILYYRQSIKMRIKQP